MSETCLKKVLMSLRAQDMVPDSRNETIFFSTIVEVFLRSSFVLIFGLKHLVEILAKQMPAYRLQNFLASLSARSLITKSNRTFTIFFHHQTRLRQLERVDIRLVKFRKLPDFLWGCCRSLKASFLHSLPNLPRVSFE